MSFFIRKSLFSFKSWKLRLINFICNFIQLCNLFRNALVRLYNQSLQAKSTKWVRLGAVGSPVSPRAINRFCGGRKSKWRQWQVRVCFALIWADLFGGFDTQIAVLSSYVIIWLPAFNLNAYSQYTICVLFRIKAQRWFSGAKCLSRRWLFKSPPSVFLSRFAMRARASAGIKILLHKVRAKMNLQRSPSFCLCAVFSLGKVWPEKLWPPGRLTRESSLRLRSRN